MSARTLRKRIMFALILTTLIALPRKIAGSILQRTTTPTELKIESTTMDFEKAIEVVMRVEGGYVNDSNDPGGETKWGISKRSFPNVNIRDLTKIEARKLYLDHYWVPGKCALMPERIRLIYFDTCVLHGLHAAAVMLQKAINGAGHSVAVDGIIGDETLRAAAYLEPERLRSYRVLRIASIVAKRPSMGKYWYGWYKRAVEV